MTIRTLLIIIIFLFFILVFSVVINLKIYIYRLFKKIRKKFFFYLIRFDIFFESIKIKIPNEISSMHFKDYFLYQKNTLKEIFYLLSIDFKNLLFSFFLNIYLLGFAYLRVLFPRCYRIYLKYQRKFYKIKEDPGKIVYFKGFLIKSKLFFKYKRIFKAKIIVFLEKTFLTIIPHILWLFVKFIIYLFIYLLYLFPRVLKWMLFLIFYFVWIFSRPDIMFCGRVILSKEEAYEWPCLQYFEPDRYEYLEEDLKKRPRTLSEQSHHYHLVCTTQYEGDQMFTITFNLLKAEIAFRKKELKGFELYCFRDAILCLLNYLIILRFEKTRRQTFDIILDSWFVVFILLKCEFKYILKLRKHFKRVCISAYDYSEYYIARDYSIIMDDLRDRPIGMLERRRFMRLVRAILKKTLKSKYSRVNLKNFQCNNYNVTFKLLYSCYIEITENFLNRNFPPFTWKPNTYDPDTYNFRYFEFFPDPWRTDYLDKTHELFDRKY